MVLGSRRAYSVDPDYELYSGSSTARRISNMARDDLDSMTSQSRNRDRRLLANIDNKMVNTQYNLPILVNRTTTRPPLPPTYKPRVVPTVTSQPVSSYSFRASSVPPPRKIEYDDEEYNFVLPRRPVVEKRRTYSFRATSEPPVVATTHTPTTALAVLNARRQLERVERELGTTVSDYPSASRMTVTRTAPLPLSPQTPPYVRPVVTPQPSFAYLYSSVPVTRARARSPSPVTSPMIRRRARSLTPPRVRVMDDAEVDNYLYPTLHSKVQELLNVPSYYYTYYNPRYESYTPKSRYPTYDYPNLTSYLYQPRAERSIGSSYYISKSSPYIDYVPYTSYLYQPKAERSVATYNMSKSSPYIDYVSYIPRYLPVSGFIPKVYTGADYIPSSPLYNPDYALPFSKVAPIAEYTRPITKVSPEYVLPSPKYYLPPYTDKLYTADGALRRLRSYWGSYPYLTPLNYPWMYYRSRKGAALDDEVLSYMTGGSRLTPKYDYSYDTPYYIAPNLFRLYGSTVSRTLRGSWEVDGYPYYYKYRSYIPEVKQRVPLTKSHVYNVESTVASPPTPVANAFVRTVPSETSRNVTTVPAAYLGRARTPSPPPYSADDQEVENYLFPHIVNRAKQVNTSQLVNTSQPEEVVRGRGGLYPVPRRYRARSASPTRPPRRLIVAEDEPLSPDQHLLFKKSGALVTIPRRGRAYSLPSVRGGLVAARSRSRIADIEAKLEAESPMVDSKSTASIASLRHRANNAKNKLDAHRLLVDRYLPIYMGPENEVAHEIDYKFGELCDRMPYLDPYRPNQASISMANAIDNGPRPKKSGNYSPMPSSTPKVSETRRKIREVLCHAKKDPRYFD